MKKILLSGMAAFAAVSAFAVEPQCIDDAQVQHVSPDGKFFVSELNGTVSFFDCATGEMTAAYGGYDTEMYGIGYGNPISNTGLVVGSIETDGISHAAYYNVQTEEWILLNAPNEEFNNYAMGVTRDGSFICGQAGLVPFGIDDQAIPMMVPVIWERKSDGSYSDCIQLPYPNEDFTGRVPQYVTALDISADGNTIFGQVVDYAGSMATLITYTRKADNTWEYSVTNDLLNPNHLTFPEWPGESPAWPQPADYLSEEEMAAYEDAVANYDWESGDPYPQYTDFMSDEEKAAYEAALAAAQEATDEWLVKFNAFQEVYFQCTAEGKMMMFNNLKPNGDYSKVYSTTSIVEEDPDSWFGYSETYAPMAVDPVTQEASLLAADNVTMTGVADNGTVYGFSNDMWREARVYPAGQENSVSIIEFFESTNPETAQWIKENMLHDVEAYDFESGEFVTLHDCEVTGTPFFTPDLGFCACAVENVWDFDLPSSVFTYVFNGVPSGVKGVAAENNVKVTVLKGGVILVEGEADMVTVYDINGTVMFRGAPVNGVVETGLTSGTYIVKATNAATVKTRF